MAKDIQFPEIEDDAPAPGAATEDVAVVIEAGPDESAQVEIQPTVEQGVEELRAQLAQERADKERERSARLAAEQQVAVSRTETRDSHLIAVTNSIALTTQELDGIEAAHAAAMEGGDFKTAAKLQREMVSKENKLSQLENGRVALEESIARGGQRQVVTEGRVEQQQPQRELTVDDHVERVAAGVSPASGQWLRSHKQAVATEEARNKLAEMHYGALAKGIAPDTPAYFAHLEAGLGYRQPAVSSAATIARRPATVSAPVNRESTPTISGQASGRTITLSKKQQDYARDMDMTNAEYAKFLYEEQVEKGLAH